MDGAGAGPATQRLKRAYGMQLLQKLSGFKRFKQSRPEAMERERAPRALQAGALAWLDPTPL
jgi:hypothetical protein